MTQTKVVPDNVDRMLLRVLHETLTAEPWRITAPFVVINDVSGALSAWSTEQNLRVRFVQDSAWLAADQASITGPVARAVSRDILDGAATVIYRLARPLEALEEVSWQVARWADEQVIFLGGQLQRHLNFSMNKVLEASFGHVSASRGYYKARALRAQKPRPLTGDAPPRIPRKNTVQIATQTLQLRAFGLTFGAAKLDPGTRLLLENLMGYRAEYFGPETVAVDLGCGNGTIATFLARCTAVGHLIATDDSASAVQSTIATLAANNIAGVQVRHQSGLSQLGAASVDVVVLNPPFHDGTELTSDIAHFLFAEASRALKPGGVLFTVFNRSRGYLAQLQHSVGPTRRVVQDRRFIVTQSQKV